MGKGENSSVIEEIIQKSGLKVWLDEGIFNLSKAQQVLNRDISKMVIGTETLSSLSFITQALVYFGKDRIIVSLDMKDGHVLSASSSIANTEALHLTDEIKKLGVSEIIVLDLARVGTGEGLDFALLKKIKVIFEAHVFVGGGVRDINDLLDLKKIGVSGVLVSTALHSGKISISDLHRLELI
jgi:phosphoribosylformimino-5-aminoimidazole carboxamide ribotide isomerase